MNIYKQRWRVYLHLLELQRFKNNQQATKWYDTLLWEQGVKGSNPGIPTRKSWPAMVGFFLF